MRLLTRITSVALSALMCAGVLCACNKPQSYLDGNEVDVRISEMMLEKNRAYPFDNCENGWIELYNSTDADMDICGWSLTDSIGTVLHSFDDKTVLEVGKYSVIPVDFSYNDVGESIMLVDADSKTKDYAMLEKAKGFSLVRNGVTLTQNAVPTPFYPNTPSGEAEYTQKVKVESNALRISELMSKNNCALTDEDGDFSDWFEIENISDKSVSLTGWSVSDDEKEEKWSFPDLTLACGERLVVFASGKDKKKGELHASFSLNKDETLYLRSPYGIVASSLACKTNSANHSLYIDENGEVAETPFITPGLPNTMQGYLDFCDSAKAPSALAINEVMVANLSFGADYSDWIEIKNTSDKAIELSDYYLSDDDKDLKQWQFPNYTLESGDLVVVYCNDNIKEDQIRNGLICDKFSISGDEAELFLTDKEEKVVDFAFVHGVGVDFSYGRMEGKNGFFYFENPTPNKENGSDGKRRVSKAPLDSTKAGIYNDVDTLSVALASVGSIYYTLDGTVPNENSALYTEPIMLDKTTIVRAIAVEEGAVRSDVATYSYIINENHKLPVLSLSTDDIPTFNRLYNAGNKYSEVGATLSLYEDKGSFTVRGAVRLAGWTSLSMPKKSFVLKIKGRYGDGKLEYDVFDNGITKYESLSIRAGQDYPGSIIRNEFFQELCLEMSDSVLTQESKYCVLYVNGDYRGIYCLKEDFSEQYYASKMGVKKKSVTVNHSPVYRGDPFHTEVYSFCSKNDLSIPENYEYICSVLDIDSVIDWFIIEGYSTNVDIQGNIRYLRSTEDGGKWKIAFYDLDWAFYNTKDFTNITRQNENKNYTVQIALIVNRLLENEDFVSRLATRFAVVNKTVLTNENALAKIDELASIIEPEVARDREKWGGSVASWRNRVDGIKNYIIRNDWENHNIDSMCAVLKLSKEEREMYFGK